MKELDARLNQDAPRSVISFALSGTLAARLRPTRRPALSCVDASVLEEARAVFGQRRAESSRLSILRCSMTFSTARFSDPALEQSLCGKCDVNLRLPREGHVGAEKQLVGRGDRG